VTVTASTATAPAVTLRDAADAFLASPRRSGANTQRAYAGVLDRVLEQLGPGRALAEVADGEVGDVLEKLWGAAAASTFNQRRAVVGAWLTWCRTRKRWAAPGVPGDCERRREHAGADRALPKATIDRTLARRDVPLREKTLWRMLYETAARAAEILALDVTDLDLEHRCAVVRAKGGDLQEVRWGTGAARLLPRLLRLPDGTMRTRGPLFLSHRLPVPARRPAAKHLCPHTGRPRLGYDRARILLGRYTGWRLHDLRHSAATHLGDKKVPLPVIMAKTRHTSPRVAMRYVHPGAEAVAEATALLDPPGRTH
jgi:integrase